MDWESTAEITPDVKARAKAKGRDLKVVASVMPLWNEDPAWAEREKARLVAGADSVAIDNWLTTLGVESGSFDHHTKDHFAFTGGGLPLMGTADDVVEGFARLAEIGVDGVLMTFLRYEEDTVRVGKELIPRMREAGLLG